MSDIGANGMYNTRSHNVVPTLVSRTDPKAARPFTSSSQSLSPSDLPSMEQQPLSPSTPEFLGPAVDSPPYPQKLRQLAKRINRASHLHRQHSHKAATSKSSSSNSPINTSGLLPWELALNNLPLVRNSSIRSNNSSIPSRDRPESVHNFGRAFFHRRGKSKRDDSTHSSKASSVYSGDASAEQSPVAKEGNILSIFSRKRSHRNEHPPKRPQISGPFNFQHVTPPQQRSLSNEASSWTNESATAALTHECGDLSQDPPYGLSSETICDLGNERSSTPNTRPPLLPCHTAPVLGPPRLLKPISSQEQLCKSHSQAPPRPPRSHNQPSGVSSLCPVPPRRTSSRQSNYQSNTEMTNLEASVGNLLTNGYHQPASSSPDLYREHSTEDHLGFYKSTHALVRDEHQIEPAEKRYSEVIPGARDSAWPLIMSTPMIYDSALPDVPEEEEHHGFSQRPRLSLASNNSSLRGSQSLPMLRCLAESQRPASGTSETLGTRGMMGVNRPDDKNPQSPACSGISTCESWEEVIDYCYEHEAEADCDYQWDRPSLDTARDSTKPLDTTPMLYEAGSQRASKDISPNSPISISHTVPDVPLSSTGNSRSLPPGIDSSPSSSTAPNNFSLPLSDRKIPHLMNLKEPKRSSGISTFRESQTFTLSPSFLIPGDYQQQMLQHQAEKHEFANFEFSVGDCNQAAFYDDLAMLSSSSKSSPLTGQRTSTSTTATGSTSRSNSTGRRFCSTNSSWTTLTRRTASSTSLNKTAEAFTDVYEPLPPHALCRRCSRRLFRGGGCGTCCSPRLCARHESILCHYWV